VAQYISAQALTKNGGVVTESTVSTLKVGTVTYPDTNGTDGQVLTTNGTGTASWVTPSAGGAFVDLTTGQTIAGAKTFSSDLSVNGVTVGRGNGDITTNASNTSVGVSVLSANTTGNKNTAIGSYALAANTTGLKNTANGATALNNNTTGNNNTAIGVGTMTANETGSDNTVVGTDAGQKIRFGQYIQEINKSVLIGAETRVNNVGEENQIVIGYQAIGNGSNTIQLGNTAITALNTSGSLTAASYIKSGGTADQFLMANGSVSTILSATYDGNSTTLSDAHSGSIIYLNADSDNLFNDNLSPGFNCTIINYSGDPITIVVHEPNYFYFPMEWSTNLTIPAGGTVNIYALMIGDSRRYYVK